MSRCFPFPPPGFVREHRPPDLDAVKEEKGKEKRHKKEKKDKERREGKQKREKERTEEKHRDKKDQKEKRKDKKEKHRDKKKEKDGRKDIERDNISDEHSNVQSSFIHEMKHATHDLNQNGRKFSRGIIVVQGTEESKIFQEPDKRISDDEKGVGNQLLNGISGLGRRDREVTAQVSVRDSSGLLAEDTGKNKDKGVDSRKMEVQGMRKEFIANTRLQKDAGVDKSEVEAMPKLVEVKERFKGKRNDKQGDTQKDKDRDKSVHGKDKKKKEKREEKAKGLIESNKSEQDRSKYPGRNDLAAVTSNRNTHLLMDKNASAVSEGSIKKVKDASTNGFLQESEFRPNKLPRLTPHQLTEKGTKFEAGQIQSVFSSHKEVSSCDICSDNEDRKVTDSNFPTEALRVPNLEILIAEASRRPPHPDSKYLSEILTVPMVEELQTDEQEWWFYNKDVPSNTPRKGFWEFSDDFRVWSGPVYIDSAEVYALPYVVPY